MGRPSYFSGQRDTYVKHAARWSDRAISYLVDLVVELFIVLVQFGLLRVVPGRHELVKLDLLPPLLSVKEPIVY